MARDFAKSFYRSSAWLHNRSLYMAKSLNTPYGIVPPHMCERCFELGKLTPAKVVHHKEHLSPTNINDPHVTLSFDNLQRLCQDCHAIVHGKKVEMRVAFDEHGRVIPKEQQSL